MRPDLKVVPSHTDELAERAWVTIRAEWRTLIAPSGRN